MNTLLASILIATLTVNTEWQDVPSDTHLGTVLNLGNGPVFVSNVAEKVVAKYDETNLTGRIGVKYEKPAGGIPMTDLAPTVYNAIYAKQDALVSGTNIKTINNQSILGPGNLDIEGTGGTSNYERLSNKPRIGGVEVVGNHPVTYYGGQTKINDYTTTNAVKSIVAGASITNEGAKTYAKSYADALVVNTNPTFTNAVLQTFSDNIGTNAIAVLNEIGELPITPGQTGGTIAGLLAALAAATAWLKRNKYQKPSGGIPSTDLTAAVQTSLGKADGAVQKSGESAQTVEGSLTVGAVYVGGTRVEVVSSIPESPIANTLYFVTGSL